MNIQYLDNYKIFKESFNLDIEKTFCKINDTKLFEFIWP